MKRKVLPLGVLAIASLLSSTALAENRGGAVVISPVIGGYHFDGTQKIDTNLLYGLKLGYNFTDRFGIEGLVEHVHTKSWYGKKEETLLVNNARLEALYHLFPKSSIVPYLAVGYGWISSMGDSGIFGYGLGAKFAATDNVALRLDFRNLIIDRGPTLYNYEYTAGLAFQFGGMRPAAKAVEAPVPAKIVPAEPVKAAEPVPVPVVVPPPVVAPVPVAPVLAPNASIAVTPQSILAGGSANLAWTSQNSSSCSIQPGIGSVQSNGSMIVAPATNTSYTLTCVGAGGTASSATTLVITKPVIKPVAVAPDSDKDGVFDALDKCPSTPVGVKVDSDGCPIPEPSACKSFTLEIEFDTNKADVKPSFQKEIKKIADFLKENPDATASIEGHTDNVGSADMNLKLSQKRADAIRTYLVKKLGIDAQRVAAKGFGLTKPRSSNKNAQGRHENRRVEALLYCGDKTIKAIDSDSHK